MIAACIVTLRQTHQLVGFRENGRAGSMQVSPVYRVRPLRHAWVRVEFEYTPMLTNNHIVLVLRMSIQVKIER